MSSAINWSQDPFISHNGSGDSERQKKQKQELKGENERLHEMKEEVVASGKDNYIHMADGRLYFTPKSRERKEIVCF